MALHEEMERIAVAHAGSFKLDKQQFLMERKKMIVMTLPDLKKWDLKDKGICAGLSVLFLHKHYLHALHADAEPLCPQLDNIRSAALFSPEPGDDKRPGFLAAMRYDEGLDLAISIQKSHVSRNHVWNRSRSKAGQKGRLSKQADASINFSDWLRESFQRLMTVDDNSVVMPLRPFAYGENPPLLEGAIAGIANGQYCVVTTDRHAMAIVCRGEGVGVAARYKFYDPNYGIAKFGTPANLKLFLRDLIVTKDFTSEYKQPYHLHKFVPFRRVR